ncbi:hypothetical protein [Acuticoccus kandeliae]|uniref:hypothetical protein n=1 Tax=Acuticoccus kandeliae TaxID=2073160 RepID=UPI00147483A6|nr:hypothetical protein [Acuticoccus kandeliae]
MNRSDRAKLSGHLASTRRATIAALCVAAIVLASALVVLLPRFESAFSALDSSSDYVAAAISESVAGDFQRAIDLGIPLREMRGVGPYLDTILEANPSVASISILDPNERVLFAAGETGGVYGDERQVRSAIAQGRAVEGAVVVVPSRLMLERVRGHIIQSAIAVAIAASLFVGILLRLLLLERRDLPQARFVAGGRAVAHGVFADFTSPRPGPFQPLGQSAARLTVTLRRAHRRLQVVVDEVRALDITRALHERIDAALAPLAAFRFDRPFPHRQDDGLLWWPLAALSAAMAVRPLVANFAGDRIGDDPIVALVVGGSVGAMAAGGLLGLALAWLVGGRYSKLATTIGTLIGAGAIGSIYLIRDYDYFIGALAIAGFGLWFAAFTVLLADGNFMRRPWHAALVLLAAAAIGPTVGALLAEAVGRRLAFLSIGGILVVIALASTAGAPRRVRPVRLAFALTASETLALAAATTALFTWTDIFIAGTALTENYATMAMHFAIIGAAAYVPFATDTRTAAATGAALAAAGVAAALLLDFPPVAASGTIGLGFGLTLMRLGARGFGGSAAIVLLVGILIAAGAKAATYVVDISPLGTSAVGASALTLLAILAAGIGGARRGGGGRR